ncbi:MAG TPA: glycosyltransferase [Opitutus sp.]|nr:glycosyltransferase [Opitutus sp.]
MKILIVQDHLRSGGTERQSVLLANAFATAGHRTTLLTFRPGGPLEPTVAFPAGRRTLQPFDLYLDWLAPGLRRAAARLAPDIALCMGRMANCYAGSLQRHLPRAAVVATMRTGKSLPFLFRRSLHRVRHIVANSAEARDLLVSRHRLPADKITVIHNSLVFPAGPDDGGATPSSRTSLRTAHHATSATLVLLNVAMFRPEKNQRELIEIAATLPPDLDWQLWLAGDGPARADCERLAAARGLADRVRFLGFLADPSSVYAAADIAVHTSSSESLSNFLIEAQAHGLPAVAYAAQGIRESFLPDRTGWSIDRGDRPAFRDRLLALARDPASVRTARADAARAFARAEFDPTRQVAAYLDLFSRLVQPAP